MNYSDKLFEQTGEAAMSNGDCKQHNDMQSVQNLETVINEGLRVALQEEIPDRTLEVLLEHLGKALNGERTYIFEQNASGGDDNTYEWVGIRILGLAGTLSLSDWKTSGRVTRFNMKT